MKIQLGDIWNPMRKIAALYVVENGVYSKMSNVECWPEARDARKYTGDYPVVCHPPCQRWGRYWSGGPSAKVRRLLGDDQGCFAAALASVRKYGGVLEHPEASHAWKAHGLTTPPKKGGWIEADDQGGWTCCVEQGHYGHRARKATWLYAHGIKLPDLKWGKAEGKDRLDEGFHSAKERQLSKAKPRQRLTPKECEATPLKFAKLLVAMARTAHTYEDSP